MASASIPLTVSEPTVLVRIAGSAYTQLSRPNKHDGSTTSNGYQVVLHDPGCGEEGTSGKDKYFDQKALPAGAHLQACNSFSTGQLEFLGAFLAASKAQSPIQRDHIGRT
jgi:hypothetical protein